MYKLFSKYGLVLAFILGLVFILIFLIPVISGLPEGFTMLPGEEQEQTTAFDAGLKATGFLLVAAVVIAVLASLWSVAKNPKNAVRGIIAVAILLVLVFVLYSTSSVEESGRVHAAMQQFNISDSLGKWISAFIKGAFALSGIAVLLAIVGEVINMFK